MLDKQIENRDSLLPKTNRPFFMAVVGTRGSGKTSLVLNLLLNHFRCQYNKIYVVSASLHSDEQKMEHLLKNVMTKPNKKLERAIYQYDIMSGKKTKIKLPPEKLQRGKHLLDTLDEEWLVDIVKDQSFIIKHFGKESADSILFVFDDLVQNDFFKSKRFLDISNRLRHCRINMVLISQGYLQIPRQVRIGVDHLILFHTANKRELKTIFDEMGCGLDFPEWLEVFKRATAESADGFSDALHIDYTNSRKKRFSIAFKDFITPDNKE